MSLANLNAHNTTLAFANLRFEMVFSNKKKKKSQNTMINQTKKYKQILKFKNKSN